MAVGPENDFGIEPKHGVKVVIGGGKGKKIEGLFTLAGKVCEGVKELFYDTAQKKHDPKKRKKVLWVARRRWGRGGGGADNLSWRKL